MLNYYQFLEHFLLLLVEAMIFKNFLFPFFYRDTGIYYNCEFFELWLIMGLFVVCFYMVSYLWLWVNWGWDIINKIDVV